MNTLDIDIIRRISTHQPTRDAYAFRIAETANGKKQYTDSPWPPAPPMVTEQVVKIGDLLDMILVLSDLAYHTAPGEMEFGGEGWTWKQQARADYDRLIAAEKEIEELDRLLKEYERKDATA